jgi:hypothetical protein
MDSMFEVSFKFEPREKCNEVSFQRFLEQLNGISRVAFSSSARRSDRIYPWVNGLKINSI